MSFNTKWDVNKYKNETENIYHWELRKSFIVAHKNKFPEARLVALSKIFANMEFLGCVYNSELMLLVKNLAKQVDTIVQQRENKKGKISRTFVPASDAAKMKITSEIPANNNTNNKRPVELVEINEESEDDIVISKKMKLTKKKEKEKAFTSKNINEATWKLYEKVRAQPGVKGKFIIFEEGKNEDNEIILQRSISKCQVKRSYLLETIDQETNKKMCYLKLDNEIFGATKTITGNTAAVRKILITMALNTLKQYCFTIKVKESTLKAVGKEDAIGITENEVEDTLALSGPGAKIMKLMGWKGEGLGKNESGIKNPIEVDVRVRKSGLGMMKTDKDFINAMKSYLIKYFKSEEYRPLQFSSEFSKDERGMIHKIVLKELRGLKAQSYGKGEGRALRITRKINGWDIVEELLANGDSNAIYTLERPSALI